MINFVRIRVSILFAIFLCNKTTGQIYFPTFNSPWEVKNPKEYNFNLDKLSRVISFAKTNEYKGDKDLRIAILKRFSKEPYHKILGPTKKRGKPSGIILKNGYQILFWGDTKRVDMTFSVTKSYLSTIAGLAVDRRFFKTKDLVKNLILDNKFDGKHNSQITWAHLLNQSSDWEGNLWGLDDWGDRPPEIGEIDDWKNRIYKTPGTYYEYNDVRVNLLAYSLLQVWREPLPKILKKYIMDPIGASTTWRWHGYENSWVEIDGNRVQSVSGGGHSGGGIFISTEDHARFGLLFLNKGKWEGKQLISEPWINEATNPSGSNASYGYMWWLNTKGTSRYWEGVPENVYYASGFGGNYIVVIPDFSMVVVARWIEPNKIGEFIRLIYESHPKI